MQRGGLGRILGRKRTSVEEAVKTTSKPVSGHVPTPVLIGGTWQCQTVTAEERGDGYVGTLCCLGNFPIDPKLFQNKKFSWKRKTMDTNNPFFHVRNLPAFQHHDKCCPPVNTDSPCGMGGEKQPQPHPRCCRQALPSGQPVIAEYMTPLDVAVNKTNIFKLGKDFYNNN